MADVTYEIILKSGSGSGGVLGEKGESKEGAPSEEMGFLSDVYNAVKQIKGFAPVAISAGIAKDLFQWQMSLVGRNTGSQAAQDKIDAKMSIAGNIIAIGGAFLGGIATANPLLIAGAIAGAAHISINYEKQVEQANYERRWENIGLYLARERAGASLNRSRR